MRPGQSRWWMVAVPVALAALLAAAQLADRAPGAGGAEGEARPAAAPLGEDAGVRAEDGGHAPPSRRPGADGLRVQLDPETGRLMQRAGGPEEVEPLRYPGDRFSTYGGDLLEEPLPGGGFKVDLRGRFQSAVVATIDPETDEVEIDCVTVPVDGEAGDEG